MRATCTVSQYTRSIPRSPEYGPKHRSLIAYVRDRRARAARERLDAALEQMAAELETALESALRGEMEAW